MSRKQTAEDRIVIVGAGIAGSLLALVLARAGRAVAVIDIHSRASAEFRAEKLNLDQLERLRRLDLLPWFEEVCWGAERVQSRPLQDCGERYDRWVERAQAAWPTTVERFVGKADRVETSDREQAVVLSDGRRIAGRLVVLATGRGERLRTALGVTRRVISAKHSTTIGFSVLPPSGNAMDIATAMAEGRHGDRLGYATIFPMRDEARINVFTYRTPDDPWIAALRKDPIDVLVEALPAFGPMLDGAFVTRQVETYCGDLYSVDNCVQPGVVLIGDATHAPCPASGTGVTRILNDIERLAQVHLPAWLATPGMGRDKIAAFYADPVKRRVDRASLLKSLNGRTSTVSNAPYWRLRRQAGVIRRRLAWAS